jgi:hypothetical protein
MHAFNCVIAEVVSFWLTPYFSSHPGPPTSSPLHKGLCFFSLTLPQPFFPPLGLMIRPSHMLRWGTPYHPLPPSFWRGSGTPPCIWSSKPASPLLSLTWRMDALFQDGFHGSQSTRGRYAAAGRGQHGVGRHSHRGLRGIRSSDGAGAVGPAHAVPSIWI